jgi:hypothetical protein
MKMRSKYKMNIRKFITALCILSGLCINLYSIEIEVIKDPKPTCIERNFSLLELVNVLSDFDKNDFLARPFSMTADNTGNFYIYDSLQCKIFKFDSKNNFVSSFGSKGQGPGEFGKGGPLFINYGKDGHLYVCNHTLRRVMSFTPDGKHIKDYKIRPWIFFNPVVDADGNFYLPSTRNGVIDIIDNNMEKYTTLLSEREYHRCLFIKPTLYFSREEIFPGYFNTVIHLLSDSRILVYIRNTAALYLLKKQKVVKKVNIWPQKALGHYKKRLMELKNEESCDTMWETLFTSIFLDDDEENYIYFQADIYEDKILKIFLYKFNLNGSLSRVLWRDIDNNGSLRFKLKKNGFFYAFDDDGNINIFKEVR